VCFGFTEGDGRKEIERTGHSWIPQTISRLIKAGMCACEVRNPAGVCCLGEVKNTVKHLISLIGKQTDSRELDQSEGETQ